MKVRNVSFPWVHMRKISSMNLFHMSGWRWPGADDNNDLSNEPMKCWHRMVPSWCPLLYHVSEGTVGF